MAEDPRMRMRLSSSRDPQDDDVKASLRHRIKTATADYDNATDRASQLQALARMARLKAALAGLEAP